MVAFVGEKVVVVMEVFAVVVVFELTVVPTVVVVGSPVVTSPLWQMGAMAPPMAVLSLNNKQ